MRLLDFSYLGPTVFWSHERKSPYFSRFPKKTILKTKVIGFFAIFKPLADNHQTRETANQKHPKYILRILITYNVCKGQKGFQDLEPT